MQWGSRRGRLPSTSRPVNRGAWEHRCRGFRHSITLTAASAHVQLPSPTANSSTALHPERATQQPCRTLTRPCSSPENTSCAAAEPAIARALFTCARCRKEQCTSQVQQSGSCNREDWLRATTQQPVGSPAPEQPWTCGHHLPHSRPPVCRATQRRAAPTCVCSARHCRRPSARSGSGGEGRGGGVVWCGG